MGQFLTDQEFEQYKTIIYDESGITFSNVNRPVLESRIKERLRLRELDSAEVYFQIIKKDRKEMDHLLDSVTTNLTHFFREDNHFKALRESILDEIAKRKSSNKRIKVWSAGCSTGEEPYSIAITLLEHLPDAENWKIDILASDISLKSLMVAKEGFYHKDKVKNIPPNYLSKYFEPFNEGYKIIDKIKNLIRFDYHNLKFDNGERDIDLVFCRNVIIYFDRQAQIEVIKKFSVCSNDNCYLFIGHSESLFGMNTDYKFNKIGNACVYRKI